MGPYFLILIAIICGSLSIFIFSSLKEYEKKRKRKIRQIKATGFKSTQKTKFGDCIFAIDDNKRQWVSLIPSDDLSPVFSYSEYVNCEILPNNGGIVISTSSIKKKTVNITCSKSADKLSPNRSKSGWDTYKTFKI